MTEQEKQKQIEEMAKVIFDKYSVNICRPCGSETACKEQGFDDCGICSAMARDIIDAGYRKADEVRKETAKEIIADINKSHTFVNGKEVKGLISMDNLCTAIARKYGVEVDK